MNINGFAKKLFAAWMAIFFLSTPILGARVAYAATTLIDIPRALEWIKTSITDFIQNTMYVAVVTSLINATSYAADRLAYDAAVKIATGGAAEEPLYDGTPNQTYLGNLVTGMAGEAIGSLSDSIDGAGGILSNFDLCAPSTPYIMLQLKLGIKGVFDRPEPKCDFNKMFGPEGTWTSFVADLANYKDPIKNKLILTELANMYDPATQEFGAGLQVSTDIFGESVFLPLIGVQENIKNSGFKSTVDFVTGNVETPAEYINNFYKETQANTSEDRKWMLRTLMADGHILQTMGTHAASVFTNTLVSKFQERIWSGLFDFNVNQTDPFDPESFALGTTQDTIKQYRNLLTAAPLQVSNYSIISEFITCPGAEARGLYNCVLDSNFVSAIARDEMGVPVTIAEAIDEGLINGSWPLIPAGDVARNQDAFCYTYGFCYGNLVKMRKARIISIGWELAASSPANTVENPVTLQEVIDGFNSCGPDGLPDDNHHWCKMIDPDWVLKYPDTQCRMQTNGELLLTDQADERAQTCVDMPSCVGEDENGNCIGYGYCVAEENTWKFRGESCPEYAASCLAFEDSEGDSVALLKNTVDPGPCTADTVGCRWYATAKEKQDDGSYAYAAIDSIANADAANTTYASRVYFNGNVEECDNEDGGCSTLVRRDTSLRLNTVANPSFEADGDADGHPDAWFDYHLSGLSWPSEISADGAYSREGEVAVSPGDSSGLGAFYQPGIELGQARTYTLSFYARQLVSGSADTVSAILDLHDENGTSVDVSGLAITGDCDDSYTNIFGAVVSTGIGIEHVQPASDASYERFTCTFTVPPLSDASLKVFGDLYFLNFDGYIDSVQLEQGADASLSVDGYSDTNYQTVVAKVAPAYLGCTGGADDPSECENYAQVCAEQDLGCTMYTPVNGDPALAGVATELDTCPSECSGYDSYRQEATLYEPDGVDSVYFIPDTATQCSAEQVGCDEFTNLATEGQEYYTFMRACVTEAQADANVSSDNKATYYTWEGSDEDGYQLRTWSLLESNLGSSDYTHIGTDGVTDTAPDQAPCSNWTTGENGIACNDTVDSDGDRYYDWDSEECNTRADIFTNANCREFYDTNGNIHYRDWEKTVTVNDACESYRKTTIAGDGVVEQEATCENSGGYYVAASGECLYYGYGEESTSCDESANGCRAYAGGRSRNSRLVLEELFEEGTLNQWDAASAANATYSNESLAADGHSMLLTGPVTSFTASSGSSACSNPDGCEESAVSFGGTCTIPEGGTDCGTLHNELYAGKTYTVSIVAKGTGTLQVGFDFNADPSAPEIDVPFDAAVALEDGWQVLTLGPLIMDASDYPLFGEGTSLVMIPTGTAYVDNIVLREGEENLTVLRNSWVTPASCDESVTGAASPQYYLGCQEYTTQEGETAYLKSFSSLCSEDKVGCDAFFKTQESESTSAQTFNATCNNIDGADAGSDPDIATSATACYYFYTNTGAFDTNSPYLCTIAAGKSSCLFSDNGFTPAWKIGNDVAVSYGPESVVTPADQDMFLVVNDAVTCASDVAGCTELGAPQWSQDRNSTTGADSVYLMNLPDTYDSILCAHEQLFCDAFTTNAADTYYFKSPVNQTCEYKTDVTVNGAVYSGWFRTGTNDFCYGTCEDTSGTEGGACGSSADCASGETCNATNPSYVIGGTESGIWKNGDSAFSGWAGSCSAAYDTCTEFQDKLAQDDGEVYGQTDGTSYFYLNNDSLSEYGLSDSQKCNGQVSLKNGCAIFHDTGSTSLTANSSATEMASRHADILFGAEPYGLVDPIDCENGGDTTITTPAGDEVDLCAKRCIYDSGEINDLTDGRTYRDKLDRERTTSTEYERDDMYTFSGSCYDATDCPLLHSESGADVEAITCGTQVRVDPFSLSSSFGGSFGPWSSREFTTGFAQTPRQENDVNTTLKVNRDRSCSEWLSCSSTNTQWDEATAGFVTTCSDIALCKGYDATTGSSFCSDWDFEKPEVVYDTDWYANRDTSWYGSDYSGMTIPNLFPVQALAQADVSPVAYCDWYDRLITSVTCENVGDACGGAGRGICLSPDDAVAAGIIDAKDYALVLNAGSCDEEGALCSVGHCEENGAACSSTSQCQNSTCIVGSCYAISADPCQTTADCSEGQECYGGACTDVGDTVAIENYDRNTGEATSCSGAETFVADASMKVGSCINSQCLLTPDGQTYDDGTTEGKICRAYPEATSPFPNAVVDAWYDPSNPGSIEENPTADALPYDALSGFENVVTCGYGEDCDCSYTKVTFGQGTDTRYYGMDWKGDISVCSGALEAVADAGEICTSGSSCDSGTCIDATGQLGICQGGDRTGGYCTENEQCGESATCEKTTREDVIYGLNGFCLEKDSSLNILGDRNKNACLSWLPVDQLAGDSDLHAKYTGAGYFEDTYMCTDVRPFVDVGMSIHEKEPGKIACAESDGGLANYQDSYDSGSVCASRVHCPSGFFGILGAAPYNGSSAEGFFADSCSPASGDNDCPFVCVPEDSSALDTTTNTYSASLCDPSQYDWANTSTASDGTPVYYAAQKLEDGSADGTVYAKFDETVAAFEGCYARGVRATRTASTGVSSDLAGVTDYPPSDDSGGDPNASSNKGYRSLFFATTLFSPIASSLYEYAGCSAVTQVASSSESYAWTDRIYTGYTLNTVNPETAYTEETTPNVFGAMNTNPATVDATASALKVAQCDNGAVAVPPTSANGFTTCPTDYAEHDSSTAQPSSGDLEGRALINFAYDYTGLNNNHRTNNASTTWTDGDVWSVEPSSTATQETFNLITQVFAGVWNTTTWIWDGEVNPGDALRGYTHGGDTNTQFTLDQSDMDVRAAEGNPPKVWSVNTQSCSTDGTLCEEGTEGRITVNSDDSGDQSGSQFFNATVKFFAAADKNQLPLRRIIMDWGDDLSGGSYAGSDADDNFFKNARGLQEGTQNSKCDLGTEWGLTEESCDPYYFTYNHIYTCSSEILRNSAAACVDENGDASGNFPCWQDQSGDGVAVACVFKPRVHVRDNWGFCSGTCTTGSDGTTACFDSDSIGSVGPESVDECDYFSANPNMDAYVDYQGTIIVTP